MAAAGRAVRLGARRARALTAALARLLLGGLCALGSPTAAAAAGRVVPGCWLAAGPCMVTCSACGPDSSLCGEAAASRAASPFSCRARLHTFAALGLACLKDSSKQCWGRMQGQGGVLWCTGGGAVYSGRCAMCLCMQCAPTR